MTRAGLQCAQLLCALGLGLSLGVIYDMYRIFIKKNHGKAWCWLGDFIWWLVALVWSFYLLVKISWAELRIPIVGAVFLGIVTYLYYFSPVLSDIYKKIASLLVGFIKRLFKIIIRLLGMIFSPIVLLTGIVYRFCSWFVNLFGRIFRKWGRASGKMHRKHKSKQQKKKAAKAENRQKKAQQKQAKNQAKQAEKANKNDNVQKDSKKKRHKKQKTAN